jgi:chromosome segregation ATPase
MRFGPYTVPQVSIAGAYRQVDALTGQVANLDQTTADLADRLTQAERARDDWCDRCLDALRERDRANATIRYLSHELQQLKAAHERLQAVTS